MENNQLNMDLMCLERLDDANVDMLDVFAASDIHQRLHRAFEHALQNDDFEVRQPIFNIDEPDDSHWDQVMMFQRKVENRHCVAIPNFACVHSSRVMFSLLDYHSCIGSGLVDDFEHWRSYYNHCTFSPFIYVDRDTSDALKRDWSMIQEQFPGNYNCPHRQRRRGMNLRTRPICCDQGCRSICWMDLNITFHRSIASLNVGMPICINAPVKGFQVQSLALHPGYRIREMFHYGESTEGGHENINEIDSMACYEIQKAADVMKMLMPFNALWCYVFDYLNPHEKMIFTSMLFDGNEDRLEHLSASVFMYGFTHTEYRYSLYFGHVEPDAKSVPSLKEMMEKRNKSPMQQMMKYATAYDMVNTINRHAVRVAIMCEWADLLYRVMHSVGEMVSGQYHNLMEDVHRFQAHLQPVDGIEKHRERHQQYIMGLYSVYEVLDVITNNPRPTAVLRLFDNLIRTHNHSIYQGQTLAHVLYELTEEECPMRHDLHEFFETIAWDFNNFNGVSPPSSVGVFLLQLLKISTIEMSYFEFLMSEFSACQLFDSCICGCDKTVLDNALVLTYKIRGMITALKG